MQYIEKDLLEYLFLEENLTKAEISERLQCSKYRVSMSLRKYKLRKSPELIGEVSKRKWQEMPEEQKLAHNQKSRAWWYNMSQEEQISFMNNINNKINNKSEDEKFSINQKRKQTWQNKSESEMTAFKLKVSENSKNNWKNMSDAKKAEKLAKQAQTWANKSQEDKDLHRARLSESIRLAKAKETPEQKQKRIQKFKNTMNNKTDAEKTLKIEKFKQSFNNVSDEVKQQRKLKRKESLAKYTKDDINKMMEKRRQNLQAKYGVDNVAQLASVKEKHSQAWQEKSEEEKNKIKKQIQLSCKKTWDKKDKKDIQAYTEKIMLTKARNKTWTVSKEENNLYHILCQWFSEDDVIRQYSSQVYPFRCDFYIKSLDLYIEANFNWTHGKEPYNPNKQSHIDQLNHWKQHAEKSTFYQNAIKVWTERDVKKYNYAKQNKLNYITFYSFKEFYLYLSPAIIAQVNF